MRAELTVSPKCCAEDLPDDKNYECIYPDIIRDYCKLRRRYVEMVTKRKRLWRLARPRTCRAKYEAPCVCMANIGKKTNLFHIDGPMYTRTQQLAYPPAFRLIKVQDEWAYKNSFSEARKAHVHRLTRLSLLSMYSRLSNAQPPAKPEKRKKFTKEQWEEYKKRLQKISQPKGGKPTIHRKGKKGGKGRKGGKGDQAAKGGKGGKEVKGGRASSPMAGGGRMGSKSGGDEAGAPHVSRRIAKLSKPKRYPPETIKEWHLTESLKHYVPTKRIREMAANRFVEDTMINHNPYAVNPNALRYKATPRIAELAIPARPYQKKANPIDAFKTSKNALRATATKRIEELARPREYSDEHTRSNPYKVSRKALRAKITPRLNEMAQPRKHN